MKRLVLAGAGHAHLHVLKSLAAQRWPGVEVVLISPTTRQIYSGMVPGWMAGHYTLDQCAAQLLPLVQAAGVRFIEGSVTAMDATQRVVHCNAGNEHHETPYDVLSLDTGAVVNNGNLAESGTPLLSIRPLESFVAGWAQQLVAFKQQGTADLVVVGGGAAGVELALAAHYRLSKEVGTTNVRVHLVAGGGLLNGHAPAVVARVLRTLADSGINFIEGFAQGTPTGVQLDTGIELKADCVMAATGVQPASWLASSGLALASDGFIAVGDGQQSTSHPEVFAAGDVASRVDSPHAKSGVYAVRAGPVLSTNLALALNGKPPACYQPQRRSLYLLATGPQHAIVSWGGFSASGHWAWRWKDWIDRKFMKQYASEV